MADGLKPAPHARLVVEVLAAEAASSLASSGAMKRSLISAMKAGMTTKGVIEPMNTAVPRRTPAMPRYIGLRVNS